MVKRTLKNYIVEAIGLKLYNKIKDKFQMRLEISIPQWNQKENC